ncbi:MAG: OmpA family protein [Myxococcota bacterium]|nr:OmpA family protein [Myxococcota bacterium]
MRATLRLGALALLLAATAVATAEAQPRGTLDRYRPAPTPEDDFHLSRASDLGHLRFGAQLTADYALNPLVYEAVAGDASSEVFSVVEHQLTGTLALSLGLFDRVVVFGGIAAVPLMTGTDHPILSALPAPGVDGAGLGDAHVGARVRLFGERDELFALALQAVLTLPTSSVPSAASYRGEPGVSFLPTLIAELRPGAGTRIVVNVGARLREESGDAATNLRFQHELTYGIGFAAPLYTEEGEPRTHLDAHLQLYGDSAFAAFGERGGTALEGTAGLRFFHASGLVLGLAAGPGLARGLGSPDLRAILNVGWVTPTEPPAPGDRDHDGILDPDDACPDEPEDRDEWQDEDGCPDPDDDADGILDADDQCPREPETMNSWRDEDGCPDEIPDTDGDGLRDDVDQCVEEPEDQDGWEDVDGCPDPDNDRDGIADGSDRCPLEAGPMANGGCPDRDRDQDTVVDRIDNCPDEPGTPENHGCRAVQRVVMEEGRLQILEMVFFRTNGDQILARSHALLRNVAAVLQAHPEIERVIVEGHTDARGRRDRNIALSQRRAESVVRFLVAEGVAAERLEARGFGPDRPQVPDARTPAEHARNRRVEFNIRGADAGVETQTESEASTDAIDR